MTQDAGGEKAKPRTGRRKATGLVIVNTGNGKGKTTAALGVLFRAWGRGLNVRMFQFIKNSGSRYGEQRAAEKVGIPMTAVGGRLHVAFEGSGPLRRAGGAAVGELQGSAAARRLRRHRHGRDYVCVAVWVGFHRGGH